MRRTPRGTLLPAWSPDSGEVLSAGLGQRSTLHGTLFAETARTCEAWDGDSSG